MKMRLHHLICIIAPFVMLLGCGTGKNSDETSKNDNDDIQKLVSSCNKGSIAGLTSPSNYKWKMNAAETPRLEVFGGGSQNTWGLAFPLEQTERPGHWKVVDGKESIGYLYCFEPDDKNCGVYGLRFDVVIGSQRESGECRP